MDSFANRGHNYTTMTLSFHYGDRKIEIPVGPNTRGAIDIIRYKNEPAADPINCIRHALGYPLGTPPLRELAVGKHSAVILISDATRLCPSDQFLPQILDELNVGGIPNEQIAIIVALGTHRRHTIHELMALTGEHVYRRVRVMNHSAHPDDCVHLGITSRGTPVEINRLVVEAELRIATGNIEPHRLAGVSGGVKAVVPGVASVRCIEHNHALGQHNPTEVGQTSNAVHLDMEEAAQHVPIDFLFNVIVNHEKQIMAVAAGDIIQAHRVGIEIAQRHFMIPASAIYDVVLASAGGWPKDMQLYQAIKSLVNASKLAKPGATILLTARCEEGYGNGLFQYWAETLPDRTRVVQMLRERFVLGAHKIEQLDQVLQKHTVFLYSGVPDAIVELLGMQPVARLEQIVHQLTDDEQARIAYMPFASLTFVIE